MKINLLQQFRIVSYFLLIFPILTVSGQQDLENYLKIAASNNATLKANFNDYLAALEKIPQVGALADPKLSFDYFTQAIETRLGAQQAKFSIVQNFAWFGTLGAKKEVAAQYSKGKLEVFEQSKSKLFYRIKANYFKIFLLNKSIEITKENIAIFRTLQEVTIIKFETGLVSAVDQMRIELEINKLENQILELENKKKVLKIKFQNLLSSNEPIILNFPDTLWLANLPVKKEILLDSIKEQNHLLKELAYKAELWQKETLLAKKRALPELSIGTSYILIGKSLNPAVSDAQSGRNAFILPKIGISLPIHRKKYKAMLRETKLKSEAISFRREDKERELATSVERVFTDFEDAKRHILFYQKQRKLTQSAINILLESYATKGKYFEDILELKIKMLAYSLELSRARSQRNTAVAFLDYLLGH